jgi:hypothetical protein
MAGVAPVSHKTLCQSTARQHGIVPFMPPPIRTARLAEFDTRDRLADC